MHTHCARMADAASAICAGPAEPNGHALRTHGGRGHAQPADDMMIP